MDAVLLLFGLSPVTQSNGEVNQTINMDFSFTAAMM